MKNFKIIFIVLVIIFLIFLLRNKEGMVNASKVTQIKKCLQSKAGGINYSPVNIVCKDGSLPPNTKQITDMSKLNYTVDKAIGTAVVGQTQKPSLQTLQQDATREKCLAACSNALAGYTYYWTWSGMKAPLKEVQMGRCVNSCVGYNSTCSLIYSKQGTVLDEETVSGWAAMNSNDVGCE